MGGQKNNSEASDVEKIVSLFLKRMDELEEQVDSFGKHLDNVEEQAGSLGRHLDMKLRRMPKIRPSSDLADPTKVTHLPTEEEMIDELNNGLSPYGKTLFDKLMGYFIKTQQPITDENIIKTLNLDGETKGVPPKEATVRIMSYIPVFKLGELLKEIDFRTYIPTEEAIKLFSKMHPERTIEAEELFKVDFTANYSPQEAYDVFNKLDVKEKSVFTSVVEKFINKGEETTPEDLLNNEYIKKEINEFFKEHGGSKNKERYIRICTNEPLSTLEDAGLLISKETEGKITYIPSERGMEVYKRITSEIKD